MSFGFAAPAPQRDTRPSPEDPPPRPPVASPEPRALGGDPVVRQGQLLQARPGPPRCCSPTSVAFVSLRSSSTSPVARTGTPAGVIRRVRARLSTFRRAGGRPRQSRAADLRIVRRAAPPGSVTWQGRRAGVRSPCGIDRRLAEPASPSHPGRPLVGQRQVAQVEPLQLAHPGQVEQAQPVTWDCAPRGTRAPRASSSPARWARPASVIFGPRCSSQVRTAASLARPSSDDGRVGEANGGAGPPLIELDCRPDAPHRREQVAAVLLEGRTSGSTSRISSIRRARCDRVRVGADVRRQIGPVLVERPGRRGTTLQTSSRIVHGRGDPPAAGHRPQVIAPRRRDSPPRSPSRRGRRHGPAPTGGSSRSGSARGRGQRAGRGAGTRPFPTPASRTPNSW